MLGICGTGMGSLAGLLKAKGYTVTGTDEAIYPPMSTQLEALGIKPNVGYGANNLEPGPDLVIVGNVITKDNPEVKAVMERQIPYLSMPQAVSQIFLEGKESIVITGTHGKTTTANILAWLLNYAGADPGFLIGGVGINFGTSYRYANGKYFVIEGDEYDTAFFDKGPKFLHYRPKYAIISSIEFDHADIYKNLGQIKGSFAKFLEIIPTDGLCVVSADAAEITDILYHAHCKVVTYGFSEQAEYRIVCHCERPKDAKQSPAGKVTPGDCFGADAPRNDMRADNRFAITNSGAKHEFATPIAGRHNLSNTAAALALLMEIGIDAGILAEGLKTFKGVKRRQEVRGVISSITVIDDFAHHPTAIRETIQAVKARYRSGRVWAIFEPRSNTTRRNIFEKELASSLGEADNAIIAGVFHAEGIPKGDRLNPEAVVRAISDRGCSAHFIPQTAYIVEFVVRNVLPGDTILVMSNGAFDNIHEKIIDGLKKRKFHRGRK